MFDCQTCRRGCRFKPDSKKNHLSIRIFLCDLHSIKRRIDRLDLCTETSGPGQTHAAAGDPDQISKSTNQRLVFQSEFHSAVYVTGRCHAHRTPGTGDQFHLRRQDLSDAAAENLMGMRSAHLHDPQGTPGIIVNDFPGRFHRVSP